MKKKIIISAGIAVVLIGIACILLLTEPPSPSVESRSEKTTQAESVLPQQAGSGTGQTASEPVPEETAIAKKIQRPEPAADMYEADEMELEEKPYHPQTTEEIKQQIYSLEIETVDDLDLLDEVVQTGDADTKDLWSAGWRSVDDWKREDNGFHLEPQEDGTYKFFPDEETSRSYTFFETPKTYTYDEVNKEFYWETDYYGKIITHKARFINDNVLVTALISGDKVVLDIYEKNPYGETPAEETPAEETPEKEMVLE